MLYQHTARFQIVLQEALRLQTLKPIVMAGGKQPPLPYTDANMLKAIGIAKGRTTLTKFRTAKLETFGTPDLEHILADKLPGGLRDHRLAQALWDHLSRSGFVRDALSGSSKKFKKKILISERQIANAISIFFNTHESQISNHAERGLVYKNKNGTYSSKDWICYKKSWLEEDKVVKSRFTFNYNDGEYFSVQDEQLSSGRFGKTIKTINEISSGIAISKTDKIWCFMQENVDEQPRVFCFFSKHSATLDVKREMYANEYVVLFGHIIETAKSDKSNFNAGFVVLVSKELDEIEFHREYRKQHPYKLEDQFDIFPLDGPHRDLQPEKKFIIPEFVKDYMKSGVPKL